MSSSSHMFVLLAPHCDAYMRDKYVKYRPEWLISALTKRKPCHYVW